MERETQKLEFDVKSGLMTAEVAKRYGVVMDGNGNLDESATRTLRAKMAKARGAVKLFDRGIDSIEKLKSRCPAETGVQPPESAEFTKWALKAVGGQGA